MEAIRVVKILAKANTKGDFLCGGIALIGIMCVICRDDFNPCFKGELQKLIVYALLLLNPVSHKLQIKILAKNLFVF